MKIIANEKESIRKILQGKETDIEKKTREIGQLTQVNAIFLNFPIFHQYFQRT